MATFDDFIQTTQNQLDKKITEIAENVFADVVDLTPVRSGYAQSRWTINKIAEGYSIENDCDYIVYLDQGSSEQAPAGMTDVALARVAGRFEL